MREIKFRVWDNVDYMSTPFTLQDLQEKKIQFTNECIVMQYVGLKDKNGKEIYEGDIFRIEEDNDIECDLCDGTGSVEGGKYIETTCQKCDGTGVMGGDDKIFYVVIVWVKEWAMFCSLLMEQEYKAYLRDGIKALDEPMFWTYTLEDTNSRKHFLCGNIYSNPELLKDETKS